MTAPRIITLNDRIEISKVRCNLAFICSRSKASLLASSKGHEDERASGRSPEPILTTAHPLPGAPKMSDIYGVTGIPSTVGGRGVVERAGLIGSTQIVYPGLGHEDA